jgi:hypothetical protein
MNRIMENGRRRVRVRRLLKPAAFVAVIVLLVFLSKFPVTFQSVAKGAQAIPDEDRDKVVVSAINGGVQTIWDESTGGDSEPLLVGVQTWSPGTNQLILSPDVSASGCDTAYTSVLDVSFTTSNRLSAVTQGAINVTVFNNKNDVKLETVIVPMTYQPNENTKGVAHFKLVVPNDLSPAFLVVISWPTAKDLNTAVTVKQVPLFQYLLYLVGVKI